jgi:hypothetical protein
MHRQRRHAMALIVSVLCLLMSGCTSEDAEDPQIPVDPAFNDTFHGFPNFTEAGVRLIQRELMVTLHTGPPFQGTLTDLQRGSRFMLMGEAAGETATVTGMASGACPGTFTGSLTLMKSTFPVFVALMIQGTGSTCHGAFSFDATLLPLRQSSVAVHGLRFAVQDVTCLPQSDPQFLTGRALQEGALLTFTQTTAEVMATVAQSGEQFVGYIMTGTGSGTEAGHLIREFPLPGRVCVETMQWGWRPGPGSGGPPVIASTRAQNHVFCGASLPVCGEQVCPPVCTFQLVQIP